MSRSHPRLRHERGTAVTETLLLTWILIVFVAASFQLFRVNQSIYSAVTSAHAQMFSGAWTANCFNRSSRCIYNSDSHAQIIWRPADLPEVIVPVVGMFRSQLPGQLRLRANPSASTPRRDGFKRTRMGAGAYYPICKCAMFGGCLASMKSPSGMGVC
jgi:hypothetical protein